MKKVAALLTAVLMALTVWAVPAQAASTPQVAPTSWYDTQRVKTVVLAAHYNQSSWNRDRMCRKFYSNPSSRFFARLALVAYRMPGISMREAARGVYKAFKQACY